MLADAILLVHFAFVLFVVGGFAGIALGAVLGWRRARHRGFRLAHLAAIMFVAFESLAGIVCPLTALENALRGGGSSVRSFVAVWVARLIYHDLPEEFFMALYVAGAALAVAAWWLVPPRARSPRSGHPRLSSQP